MELALLFKVKIFEGKFLAIAGESAKILPLQNFALCGNHSSIAFKEHHILQQCYDEKPYYIVGDQYFTKSLKVVRYYNNTATPMNLVEKYMFTIVAALYLVILLK